MAVLFVTSDGLAIPADSIEQVEKNRERIVLWLAAEKYKKQAQVNQQKRDERKKAYQSLQNSLNAQLINPQSIDNSSLYGNPVGRQRKCDRSSFYKSSAWKKLRYKVLKTSNGKCALCGCGAADGVVLHVDHIIPRSKRPDLSLDANNLQVLCDACNLAKSNRDEIDWRRKK